MVHDKRRLKRSWDRVLPAEVEIVIEISASVGIELDVRRWTNGKYRVVCPDYDLFDLHERLVRRKGVVHGAWYLDKKGRSWAELEVEEESLLRVLKEMSAYQSRTSENSTNRTLIDNGLDGCNSLVGSCS